MKILSLDGGGIRGLYTLRLIQRIQFLYPDFLSKFDMIAGTSTGGIIALGLGAGFSIEQLIKLYKDNAELIFDRTWLERVRDMGGLTGAKYCNSNLDKLMKQYFGQTKMKWLSHKVLIPTFKLYSPDRKPENWRPKFFHNFIPISGEEPDREELVSDIAMRTSAAPTYFPTYEGYVDGGVVANNPSMAAIAQCLDDRYEGNCQIKDITLLSIGTGFNTSFIKVNSSGKDQKDWGIAQWGGPIIDVLMDGSMDSSSYFCQQLLDGRFCRLNALLPKRIAMDDYKKIPQIMQAAEKVSIEQTIDWVGKYLVKEV